MSDLKLGYAVTIHKSQGSEFKAVILIASNGGAPPTFYNRNMLYTGLTRGKELVIVMTPSGNTELIKILKTDEGRRNTILLPKLTGRA
jgi:ATP-dependent exoDNAse (exonuclease V) alpha subunit